MQQRAQQQMKSPGFAQLDPARFDQPHAYAAPAHLPLNHWALTGKWAVGRHAAVSKGPPARIAFRFHVRDVIFVMGPLAGGASIPFRVLLDGQVAGAAHGSDVAADGSGTVSDQRTYQLIRQPGPIADRLVEIEFLEPGAEAYCFTFG